MMMQHFLDLRNGRMCWLTVFPQNFRALAFYKKKGFVKKEGEEIVWSDHMLLDQLRDVDVIYYYEPVEN